MKKEALLTNPFVTLNYGDEKSILYAFNGYRYSWTGHMEFYLFPRTWEELE